MAEISESIAPQPSSEGLDSTRARRRESAGGSAHHKQPSRPPPPPLPREGGDRAGVMPGSAAIHAAGTPAFPAARHGATRDPFRGPQLLEPPLKWNRGRPGANPSAPRGCGRRRAPPLSGPRENPQCRTAVVAPGSSRPLSPPGVRGAGPRTRGHPPSPARAPHAAEAAASPGSSQPPRSGSAAANKDASHWSRRGPLPQQGRCRLAPAAPRPPRRTRAMLTVRRCGARPIRARGRGARGAAGAREASA